MKNWKKFVTGAVAALGISSGASAAIITDFVFIVDESGSMSTVQSNLQANIPEFAQILSDGGVDAQYALVGYGSSGVVPRLLSDLTDPASLQTAAANLVIDGGIEDGYAATGFALNALDGQTDLISFREDSIINLVIFTDEDADVGDGGTSGGNILDYAATNTLVGDNGALFNAVVNSSAADSTDFSFGINGYRELAENNGGQVFDLSAFAGFDQAAIEQFVDDFANAKLQETIIAFCDRPENANAPQCTGQVPVPGTLFLFGLGLVGLGARRALA